MLYDVGALYCITNDNWHPSALLQPLCVGLAQDAQGTALMLKQSLFERLLSGKLLGLISASLLWSFFPFGHIWGLNSPVFQPLMFLQLRPSNRDIVEFYWPTLWIHKLNGVIILRTDWYLLFGVCFLMQKRMPGRLAAFEPGATASTPCYPRP